MTVALHEDQVNRIIHADHGDPFGVFGPHPEGASTVIRAFVPDAPGIVVVDEHGDELATLDCLHPAGLHAGRVEQSWPFVYRLRVAWPGGAEIMEDPYRFSPTLGEADQYLLAEGTHQRAWEVLGAHLLTVEGVAGTVFRVWAPGARRVAVVGEFNGWDGRRHPMRFHPGCGVWELFVPGVQEGALYKYEVKGGDGARQPDKADPVGFYAQVRPGQASRVASLDHHRWADENWLKTRQQQVALDQPVSIYEIHTGSWRLGPDGDFLNYRELADQLIPYVQDMGFTHVELMPVHEFPFDGSWGYQPVGLYAPTSRHGSPEDFMVFVDKFHQAGIGVLLDWVPGHFPTDGHGLGYFDGSHLYEHAHPWQGFHQDWNTLIYNFGRLEVANFLLANALFWLERYHIDGLRVDAVASMLYLDYSRKDGEWIPNVYGGRENLEAISLIRRANQLVEEKGRGAIAVAEESTAWGGVSKPITEGGLGFNYKWNMGWMHDTLDYMSKEPVHRRYHHHQMTFGLLYAFTERFILPLSHDEVVHGKGSLLARMPGDAWQKFANLRAYFGFMWTMPGKKLLFMGGEFAQGREWNHEAGLDWHLLDIHWHQGMQRLVRELNHRYRTIPALHQRDCDGSGFCWLDADNADASLYSYLRFGRDDFVVVLCNFTPVPREGIRLGVPAAGTYREIINTDAADYGGSGVLNGELGSEALSWHNQPHCITVTAPPLATVVFQLAGS